MGGRSNGRSSLGFSTFSAYLFFSGLLSMVFPESGLGTASSVFAGDAVGLFVFYRGFDTSFGLCYEPAHPPICDNLDFNKIKLKSLNSET